MSERPHVQRSKITSEHPIALPFCEHSSAHQMSAFAFFNEVKESKHERASHHLKGFPVSFHFYPRHSSTFKGNRTAPLQNTPANKMPPHDREINRGAGRMSTARKAAPTLTFCSTGLTVFLLCSHIFTIILHCLKAGGAEQAQLSEHGGQEQTANVTGRRRCKKERRGLCL